MNLWEKQSKKAMALEDDISSEVHHFPEIARLPGWPGAMQKVAEMDDLTSSFIILVNRPD